MVCACEPVGFQKMGWLRGTREGLGSRAAAWVGGKGV